MFRNFELLIAFNYLRFNKTSSFLSLIAIIAIALGISTLFISLSIMNGFHKELFNKIISANGNITFSQYKGSIKNYESIEKQILKIKGVNATTPFIYGQIGLNFEGKTYGVQVKGISNDFLLNSSFAHEIIKVKHKKEYPNGIVLGKLITQKLSIMLGEEIHIIAPSLVKTDLGLLPYSTNTKFVGMASFGMSEYDSNLAFTNLSIAQEIFKNGKNYVDGFDVYLESWANESKVIEEIIKIGDNINKSFNIKSWRETQEYYFNMLEIEKRAMQSVLLMIIIISSFNMISSLIVLIREKKYDIAILQTMGASKFSIFKIFLICGLSIYFISLILGFSLGFIILHYIDEIINIIDKILGQQISNSHLSQFYKIPYEVCNKDIISIFLYSFTIVLIFILIPAFHSTNKTPSNILR